MSRYVGSVFDRETPNVIRVSRVAGATVLTLCAVMFYALLFS